MSNFPPTVEYHHVPNAQIFLPWWMKLSAGLVALGVAIGLLGLIRALIIDKDIELLSCIGACCLLSIGVAEWFGVTRRMISMLILVGIAHLLFALLLIPGMLWVWHHSSTFDRICFGLILCTIVANATCHFAFAGLVAIRTDLATR